MMMSFEAQPRSGGFPTADRRKTAVANRRSLFVSIRQAPEEAELSRSFRERGLPRRSLGEGGS
jgi:hypothetical protein